MLWGQAEEIVHNIPGEQPINDAEFLSQLLWDFKPLLYLGADIGIGPGMPFLFSGFTGNFSFMYGLPLKTGKIEDRDWNTNGASFLTHYSVHDTYSEPFPGSLITELSLGYSWALGRVFWLKVFGELSYSRFSWLGMDGYKQYGAGSIYAHAPWHPDLEKVPTPGNVIDYAQNWFTISPGISAGMNLYDFCIITLSCAVSPLSFGYCVDDHLDPSKTITYHDYLFGGISVKGELGLEFALGGKFNLGVDNAIRYHSRAIGDTIQSESGSALHSFHEKNAGGSYLFYELSVWGKYSF